MNEEAHLPTSLAANHPRTWLTVIIVNHESWAETARLSKSLMAEPEFSSGHCRIVVVDNASRTPVPDDLTDERPGFELILRAHNDGFAAGVNAGWRVARSPWLLILNPDVEVAQGFLGQVFVRLGTFDSAADGRPGIVGFGLRNSDGSPQGSVGVFPSLGRTIREQFIPRPQRKYQADWRIRTARVDWVTGACMLVNSAMIEAVGGMDEDFFLYHEEVAFSLTAQRLGWTVQYDPTLWVVHRHPLQNRAISPKMRVITRHSKLLYFRKHLPHWQFSGLQSIVAIEAAIRGPWSRLMGSEEEARAWRTIGAIAARMGTHAEPRGRDVLAMADDAVNPPDRGSITPAATATSVLNDRRGRKEINRIGRRDREIS